VSECIVEYSWRRNGDKMEKACTKFEYMYQEGQSFSAARGTFVGAWQFGVAVDRTIHTAHRASAVLVPDGDYTTLPRQRRRSSGETMIIRHEAVEGKGDVTIGATL
jgi:hypothetical protein